MSTTYDEPQSIAYGEQILHLKPSRSDPLFNSKSPMAALNAIPRLIADHLEESAAPPLVFALLRSPRFARVGSVLALLILNLVICRWVYELYGPAATLAVSILVVFSPNLVAHGTLATNDGYFALGTVLSLYFFRRYLLHPTASSAWASGLTLGLAQLTKSFAIYLYAVVLLFLLFLWKDAEENSSYVGRKTFVLISVVCFIVAINVGFGLNRSFTPLKSYRFDSETFLKLQTVPLLRSLPLPLPYPFLQGLDMLKYHDDSGLTYGKIYLLGELRDPYNLNFHNFKSYYAVAMFFKEPIPLQILCVLGLAWICKNRRYRELVAGEGLLIVAAVTLFVWFSLFRKSQLGIRNILPVLAINVIIAGAAFSNIQARSTKNKILLGFLLLWMCASVMSYYPNLIPYMNEWVVDRKQSYRILVDSNLDYGQESGLVHEFLRRNQDVVLDPEHPISGRVLVSVNRLVGEWHGYEPMCWLLRHRPAGRVGYGHLLFFENSLDLATEEKNNQGVKSNVGCLHD